MAGTTHPGSEGSPEKSAPDVASAPGASPGGPALPPERPAQPPVTGGRTAATQQPELHKPAARSHPGRRLAIIVVVLGGLAYAGYSLAPAVKTALNTVSTDDAYVNGHVTFVAPRVSGQVIRVFVDDNMRVKTGERARPARPRTLPDSSLAVKQAAVDRRGSRHDGGRGARARRGGPGARQSVPARAGHRGRQYQGCRAASQRGDLKSRGASLDLARANLQRGEELLPSGGISKEDLDIRRQSVKVAEAGVDQALQAIYASRVGLGLPAQTPAGKDLGDTPPDLSETFSSVRQALGLLIETGAELGYAPANFDARPKEAIEAFYKQDPSGDLERIYAKMIPQAPAIKQAQAKLLGAKRELAQAELDLRYCDVISEIDGVVTRRNVNVGNNVQAGQALMAVRSLTEIWIDANFKETQLGELRIGQRVRCEVDMYGTTSRLRGAHHRFHDGHRANPVLLPPQNATGNLREDRPAPAGSHRADRLRSRQDAPCSSVCPWSRTCTSRRPPAGPNAGALLAADLDAPSSSQQPLAFPKPQRPRPPPM